MNSIKNKGFTLIELVVAMAIFAVLTLSGWQVFNNLIKVRERTTIKAEQLALVQEAYEQLSRDFVQAVPRPVSIGTSIEPAFLLQNNVFHLTRTGVIDPLQQGVSPMQRVYYTVEHEQLVRYAIAQVDQDGNAVPNKTVLLNNVSNWSVNALSNTSSSPVWPIDTSNSASANQTTPAGDITLPTAVQITLTANGQPLRWLFALVTNMPAPAQTGSSTGSGTNSVVGGASAAATGATTSNTSSSTTSGTTSNTTGNGG
ncbi:MAG: type II secretion system minor pseudopilin GspJ [Gammaproteobacteria bacterium]|nr:type II secretion system minor pseudopilin GspJ [Gammaproteobacteria bacterium]